MFKISRSILINAPVEKVFCFMEDPANLPEIWPSMIEVTNIRTNAKGWPVYEWMYKMGGMKFRGESNTIEYERNCRIITESTKGIQSHFDFQYRDMDGKTEMKMDVEYTVPLLLVSKIAEQVLGKFNEHEADVMLANLKADME